MAISPLSRPVTLGVTPLPFKGATEALYQGTVMSHAGVTSRGRIDDNCSGFSTCDPPV